MIDKEHQLPITKQCTILQLSRSSVYYVPVEVNDTDRELMRLIDAIHLEEPYLGSRGMKGALRMRDIRQAESTSGLSCGRWHCSSLQEAVSFKAHPGHKIYPYLLRESILQRGMRYGARTLRISQWRRASATSQP